MEGQRHTLDAVGDDHTDSGTIVVLHHREGGWNLRQEDLAGEAINGKKETNET